MATFSTVPRPRTLAALLALLALPTAGSAVERVYVAVGGSAPQPGAARAGDPSRVGASLARQGFPVRVVDLTAEGATAAEVREVQLRRALAVRPRVVTVSLGPADAAAGTPLKAFARDVHVIVDLLRRNGAAVLVSTAPATGQGEDAPAPELRRRLEAFDAVVRRLADHNRVVVVDVRRGRTWEDAHATAVAALLEQERAPARRAMGGAPGKL